MTVDQPRAIVAQLGARMHYAVPRILYKASQLDTLYTDFCSGKGWPRLFNVVPSSIRPTQLKKLIGRIPQDIPTDLITAFNNFGLECAYRRSRAATATEETAVNLWAGDKFNSLIIQKGTGDASLVYGHNSASEKMFLSAKQQGLTTVLEQTIAPKSVELKMLQEEALELSNWGYSLEKDAYVDRFIMREKAEWDLADLVICGSEFVRQNVVMEGGDAKKCVVVPYGIDLTISNTKSSRPRQRYANSPLQVLFVGSLGLRKGIHYLIEAMRQLERASIQCRIIGKWSADIEPLLSNKPSNVEFCGSVPRSEIFSEYHKADVFCLPSLCEGSATVIYEALASGLPIITTPNSGSIIRDGIEGYIVPIRDSGAITERLENFLSNSAILEQMSCAAKARSQYGSFGSYSERLVKALSGDCEEICL